jgi:hypothetical protein
MKFRLCAEDREKYAGPEWVEFTVDLLADQTADFCEHVEETIGWTIVEFSRELERASTRGVRAAFWVGRRIAGCDEPWKTFNPKVWKAEQDSGDDDAPLAPAPKRRSTGRARASRT